MRDLKSDWKRWSHAERFSAIALVTFVILFPGFSILPALLG
jgi:hypothetical protein